MFDALVVGTFVLAFIFIGWGFWVNSPKHLKHLERLRLERLNRSFIQI